MKKQLTLVALLAFAVTAFAQQPDIQYFRPWDQEGVNTFEPSKSATQTPYTGFKIRVGGSFTQQYQDLAHENDTTFSGSGNELYALGPGFNLATANLNFDFQIEDGIRVSLENYMSARHHPEFWVKGGYIQIDKLPMFGNPQWFEKYLRVKIGHFQPNYGDQQFRRTDNGNAIWNPFVGNYIMDAFTTEIGGEVYIFPTNNFMLMAGMTSGFINGNINAYPDTPLPGDLEATRKNPSIFFKAAYDNQVSTDLRVRLSASYYGNTNVQRNTLYAGDRTGSRYYLVLEKAGASATSSFTSGRVSPDFTQNVSSFQINPFIKFKGIEFFGTYESARGKRLSEADQREMTQIAGELILRFLPREQLFVAGRYNQISGRLRGFDRDISVDRVAIAAGWFATKNLLLKGEYVIQNYTDFPNTDIRYEGQFSGWVIEAVVGF